MTIAALIESPTGYYSADAVLAMLILCLIVTLTVFGWQCYDKARAEK